MKKLMNKKINVFGKGIPMFAIVLMSFALVSAALIPYFGQITGSVTVSQGLTVDGQEYSEGVISDSYDAFTSLEEKTFVTTHSLENNADVWVEVDLDSSKSATSDPNSLDDMNVKYYDLSDAVPASRGVMVFKGSLTDNGDGTYDGTIGALADFDLYAKEGSTVIGTADIDGYSVLSDNDAYPNWDPDVPDAYDETNEVHEYYALSLDSSTNTWELWYVEKGTFNKLYDPMSGDIMWDSMFATETNNDWEETWTWGYENVQLESEGFSIEVVDNGDGTFTVTLTPVDLETELTNPLRVDAGESEDFAIVTKFPKMTYPDTYTVTTTVNPTA